MSKKQEQVVKIDNETYTLLQALKKQYGATYKATIRLAVKEYARLKLQ